MKKKNWVFNLKYKIDKNGKILILQKKLNFKINRVYFIFSHKKSIRGNHSQKKNKSILIPLKGSFEIKLIYKNLKKIITLDAKKKNALYVPNLAWRELSNFSKDSICAVLCSTKYNHKDYIYNLADLKKYEKN
jgi:dTDP-4-dehydrorhamnose 3,5-epimerase-like enzyme